VDGYNIHLTIDQVIQSIAEKALAEGCKKHNALGGSAIVIDPKSGDILAMAMYPQYDLNNSRKSSAEARRNRAITDLFEPGSVSRPSRSPASCRKDVPAGREVQLRERLLVRRGEVLHDHHGYGLLSFREVIENRATSAREGAMRLGATKLYKYIKDFGFGNKTGIALAGEVSGLTPAPRAGPAVPSSTFRSGRAWPSRRSSWPPRSGRSPTTAF